jgi:hypothetical protein
VWALALFPSSLVFSTLYPSSIFLAASVFAFLAVEDDRDVVGSLLAVVCALARPNGFVVALCLAVAVRNWRRAAVVAGPALVALGVWLLVLRHWTGDALIFLHAKAAWVEITLLDLVLLRQPKPTAFAHAILAILAIAALVVARRRLPLPWLLFGALYLLPSTVLGVVGLGRYSNECFPVFVAAGLILAEVPGRLRNVGFGLSVAGLGVLGVAVAAGRVVP